MRRHWMPTLGARGVGEGRVAGGLGATRLDSGYEWAPRSGAWQKMRVNRGQEFVVGANRMRFSGGRLNEFCIRLSRHSREATMNEQVDDEARINGERVKNTAAEATEMAKAKNGRLNHMRERNENYLAERRGEEEKQEDQTEEL
jgi:hypothetical protein